MSKRNFILLIIILVAILAAFFGFLFLRQGPVLPGEEGGGTNFLSQFNPFGAGGGKPDDTTPPPVDISGSPLLRGRSKEGVKSLLLRKQNLSRLSDMSTG